MAKMRGSAVASCSCSCSLATKYNTSCRILVYKSARKISQGLPGSNGARKDYGSVNHLKIPPVRSVAAKGFASDGAAGYDTVASDEREGRGWFNSLRPRER